MLKLPEKPILNLVTDQTLAFEKMYPILESALRAGVNLLQYRNKMAVSSTLYQEAQALKLLCQNYCVPLIINDHIDLAIDLDLDGVHIGQEDISPELTRERLGETKIIGLSISSVEEALLCQRAAVDYFGIGPIFATQNKAEKMAMGMEALEKILGILEKPCLSIGGMNEDSIDNLPSSIAGISVISAISTAKNPAITSRILKEKLCKITSAV